MTHFHLYTPSGILPSIPSIKIPKIKLQKKLFAFGIGRTRDSYNVTSSQPDKRKFVPTISLRVHESVDESIAANNPDRAIGDKQKIQINSNFAATCNIHNQNNLQNLLGASAGCSCNSGGGGGIILNIPLKANNNARRAPRDMNHEKFTPCQRFFHQHENSITDYHNKNVKFCKGAAGREHDEQVRIFYEDDVCCSRNDMVKIAPPPRKKKSLSISSSSINGNNNHNLNEVMVMGDEQNDFNFMSSTSVDGGYGFVHMNMTKRCHDTPNNNNKSDPWMVAATVDQRKLEKPPTASEQNTNYSSVPYTFEDEFVNENWINRNLEEKRTAFKQQRHDSVNIFELGNTINVFDDFDDIFDTKSTAYQPEQLTLNYDCDRQTNKIIGWPHATDMGSNNKRTAARCRINNNSATKTVSFTTGDAYGKTKKESTNVRQHNGNIFVQKNQGSENGFPTFEYSGNQNIAVNHMLNEDVVERRMGRRDDTSYHYCAERTTKCERDVFGASVGNENLFADKFRLEQFRNNIERSVRLDEKCLTIVLDLLDNEWRTGNINGK